MERKLIAILVGDVVGYSRLIGADEGATVEVLQSCLAFIDDCVASHGGRTFNSAGDSVLCEFGSVLDATRCALEVQEFFEEINEETPPDRQLRMRFGIHLGDVIVDGQGYLGDGVNIAARLEPLAEPGGLCISDAAYQSVAGRLDLVFEDIGEISLKNISRPVRAYRSKGRSGVSPSESSDGSRAPDPETSKAPAIAVLPFVNMGDPESDETFVDGLTEDLITALAAWRSFPVIARNSTFAYKGQSPDVRTAARDLGAHYVLEGSVRMSGSRVRVNAQLIDATSGHHIWAEKFDRQLEDIFDVQDEITRYLAAIVAPEVERSEQRRVAPARPKTLKAWELHQRGMALVDKWTREATAEARTMFLLALEREPDYCQAMTGLAYTHHRDVWFGYSDSRTRSIEELLACAERAVSMDSGDSLAHCMLGFAYLWSRQFDLAIASGERALSLNPSNHVALSQLGLTLCMAGRPADGIRMLERAIEINPRNPRIHFSIACLARAHLDARDVKTAKETAQRALTYKADYAFALLILASALGHLGHERDARDALARCEAAQPGFAERWAATAIHLDTADDQHLLDGLKAAGLDNSVELHGDVSHAWPT